MKELVGSESVERVGSSKVGSSKGENKVSKVRVVEVDNRVYEDDAGVVARKRFWSGCSVEEQIVLRLDRLYRMDIEIACFLGSSKLLEVWRNEVFDELEWLAFAKHNYVESDELMGIAAEMSMGNIAWDYESE